MFERLRLPRRLATATLAGLTLATAAALAVPASAASLPPAGSGPALALPASGLLGEVQYWGPHYGPRPYYGPGPYGWHRRHAWGGPRCTVSYVRTWDGWRGIYVSRPVRRCW